VPDQRRARAAAASRPSPRIGVAVAPAHFQQGSRSCPIHRRTTATPTGAGGMVFALVEGLRGIGVTGAGAGPQLLDMPCLTSRSASRAMAHMSPASAPASCCGWQRPVGVAGQERGVADDDVRRDRLQGVREVPGVAAGGLREQGADLLRDPSDLIGRVRQPCREERPLWTKIESPGGEPHRPQRVTEAGHGDVGGARLRRGGRGRERGLEQRPRVLGRKPVRQVRRGELRGRRGCAGRASGVGGRRPVSLRDVRVQGGAADAEQPGDRGDRVRRPARIDLASTRMTALVEHGR
jgi:hypothetical protein